MGRRARTVADCRAVYALTVSTVRLVSCSALAVLVESTRRTRRFMARIMTKAGKASVLQMIRGLRLLAALTVAGCGHGSAPFQAAPYVHLSGVSEGRDGVDITWRQDGGSVTVTYADGVSRQVWFEGKRGVVREVSGDLYDLAPSDVAQMQAERVFLTAGYRRLAAKITTGPPRSMAFYQVPGGGTMWVQRGDHGEARGASIGNDVIWPVRYDGNYAIGWTSTDGFVSRTFELRSGPGAALTFPSPPPNEWERSAAADTAVAATVSGHPAHVRIDTTLAGLRISDGFAKRIGVRPLPLPIRTNPWAEPADVSPLCVFALARPWPNCSTWSLAGSTSARWRPSSPPQRTTSWPASVSSRTRVSCSRAMVV